LKRLADRLGDTTAIEWVRDRGQERHVGQISHARIRRGPWKRVRVQLLREVGLDRDQQQLGCGNPGEPEVVFAPDRRCIAQHVPAEHDIEAEPCTVDLSGELALDAKPPAAVYQAIAGQLCAGSVGLDLERHEVAEIELPQRLKPRQDRRLIREDHEVDVSRGARAIDPDLEAEPALEHDAALEAGGDAREQALKHEQLATALDPEAGCTSSQSIFERLLEVDSG
jgi:hypothetical protein